MKENEMDNVKKHQKEEEIRTSCNPLPSAASLLSSGIVNPLLFFQLEIHGGIIHSFCSAAVAFLGGLLSTGAGGLGGPRGIFLCLKRGGSSGSSATSDILMMRCFKPPLVAEEGSC